MKPKYRVLFVCLGNICRSPTAEAVFRQILVSRGFDGQIEVDSAGVSDWHEGEAPDPRMSEAAISRGYELNSTARPVKEKDFAHFDLIVAMDRENLRDLLFLAPQDNNRSRICLLSDFLPGREGTDVPDPYYGGPDGFERVLDMIEEACNHLAVHLAEQISQE